MIIITPVINPIFIQVFGWKSCVCVTSTFLCLSLGKFYCVRLNRTRHSDSNPTAPHQQYETSAHLNMVYRHTALIVKQSRTFVYIYGDTLLLLLLLTCSISHTFIARAVYVWFVQHARGFFNGSWKNRYFASTCKRYRCTRTSSHSLHRHMHTQSNTFEHNDQIAAVAAAVVFSSASYHACLRSIQHMYSMLQRLSVSLTPIRSRSTVMLFVRATVFSAIRMRFEREKNTDLTKSNKRCGRLCMISFPIAFALLYGILNQKFPLQYFGCIRPH